MELLHYLLKVNVAFILLFGCYGLCLRGLPLFKANRVWLLCMPLAAFLLPLMELPAGLPMAGVVALSAAGAVTSEAVGPGTPAAGLPLLMFLYLGGVAVSMLVLTWRFGRAWRLSGQAGEEPLSFFGRTVLPTQAEPEALPALRAHEQAHADQGHSADVLYYELMCAISWWNPLWRLALRELRLVHELQADAAARPFHPDYSRLLLAHALGVPMSTLTNSFRSTNLKTRIRMLNSSRPKHMLIRYASSLPALAVALVLTASPRAVQTLTLQEPVYDLATVEVQPEFPGGTAAMYTFLGKNIHYPDKAMKDQVEGKVYVEFIVAPDGKVTDVQVRRGIRKDLDDEAMRAIKAMPIWSPGKIAGKAVATRFLIPVAFTLEKKKAPSGK